MSDDRPAPESPVLRPDPNASAMLPAAQMLRMTVGPKKQLGYRVSGAVHQLLMETSQQTGVLPARLLEYAIVQTFATEEGRQEWQGK